MVILIKTAKLINKYKDIQQFHTEAAENLTVKLSVSSESFLLFAVEPGVKYTRQEKIENRLN